MCILCMAALKFSGQTPDTRFKEGLKIYLKDDSSSYIKATGLLQTWARYNQNNPGSTVFGTPQNQSFDVGMRRIRYQVFAQISKKVFFYSQFGINNFNSISARKTPLFFHDATAEYALFKNYISIGMGLHGWNGTCRYSSSAVGSILALDLPFVAESTNDVSDQFVRKTGLYAKGQLGRISYRYSVSNPLPVQTSLVPIATLPATGHNTSYYSSLAPKLQHQGYADYQFFDKETVQIPYMAGSYLGKKRLLNLGAGFNYQPGAMWHRNTDGDTSLSDMKQLGIDLFYDSYLDKEKQNAVTAYAAYFYYDFGPNYLRNVGIMNPANGTTSATVFNGPGNAFPAIGTGQLLYAQAAYLFRKNLLKQSGTLQPCISGFYAKYQRLDDPVLYYTAGLNWLIAGQGAKISVEYQNRPLFKADLAGNLHASASNRKGAIVLQYQVMF